MIKIKPNGNAKDKSQPLPAVVRPAIGGPPKKRGHPSTEKAMTNAQRQAKFKGLMKVMRP